MRQSSKVRKTIFPGLCFLLCLPIADACAQPLKFICDLPQGKRLEQTGIEKQSGAAPVWVDETLENIRPAVTVDGETLTITWGSAIPNPSKAAAPKATTYVFASAYRNDQSIVATRIDRAGAEIFRFYFGSKTLVRLATVPGNTAAPILGAIQTTNCKDQ